MLALSRSLNLLSGVCVCVMSFMNVMSVFNAAWVCPPPPARVQGASSTFFPFRLAEFWQCAVSAFNLETLCPDIPTFLVFNDARYTMAMRECISVHAPLPCQFLSSSTALHGWLHCYFFCHHWHVSYIMVLWCLFFPHGRGMSP